MRVVSQFCFVLSLSLWAAVALISSTTLADPLPGEILKFQQLPLNNGVVPGVPVGAVLGAPFPGHDELSTATLSTTGQLVYQGQYMADDFADKFLTPVVHVRWWGSYLQNQVFGGVKQFLISFEKDVPVTDPTNTTGYSHPGVPLLNQIVTLGPLAPGSGTFTESFIPTPSPPPGPEALYQYNAELNLGKEFPEHPDTVYWLKIVALVDPQRDGPIAWGWHDRDWSIPDPLASTPPAVVPGEGIVGAVGPIPPFGGTLPVWHFQDDAVTGPLTVFIDPSMPKMPTIDQPFWTPTHYVFPFDGPDNIGQFSKDLAFELYTRVPEPSSMLLIGLGGLALATMRRRGCR
jgi:PEP-CTERM motif